MSDYASIVRTAYAPATDEEAWVRSIAQATHAVFGTDVAAYVLPDGEPGGLRSLVCIGETYRRIIDRGMSTHRSWGAKVHSLYGSGPFALTWSDRVARLRRKASGDDLDFLAQATAMNSVAQDNTLGIYGGSANTGIMLCVQTPRESLAPRTSWALRRVAVHLAAVLRLRSATEREPDAWLDASGSLLESRTELEASDLDQAAAHARARNATSQHDRALSVWEGLVAGRWSLVQARERNGRRTLVLRRNELTEAAGDDRLSRRISSVAALAARGHSNKLIAYELGLPMSTVAEDIRTTLDRLGLARRADLVTVARDDD